ncbi:MAG: hypothetical protein SGBAC_001645 [Bacillariaceae sp.]
MTSKQSVEEIFAEIDKIDINSIELHPDAIKYLDTLQSYLQCFDELEDLYNRIDPNQMLANHDMPDMDLPIQQFSLTGEPVQNLVELYEVAEVMFPVFVTKIEKLIQESRKSSIPKGSGIEFRLPPGDSTLKGKQRASEKANDDYSKKEPGPPESWLDDIVRGSVTFDRAEELLQFLDLICLDDSIEIVKSKNRFRNPALSGYRDWNLQLQITADDGFTKHICELQLHHTAIEEADMKLGSHKFYEFFRKFFAGATGTLQDRLNDLRMISTGGSSLNMSFLKSAIDNPIDTGNMKSLADLFENHVNDFKLAMIITNAIREQFEPTELYSRMGTLFWRQSKLKEATVMYEKALDIQLQVNGPDHIATAQAYNNMANVLYSQGKLEKSMNMHRRALYSQLKAFGPDNTNTTTTYNNMAIILRKQGRLAEALALYQKTLDVRLRTLGPNHTRTANTYSNMANVLQNQGKLKESLELHHRALDIRLRTLGADHHLTANTYFTIGSVVQDQGKLEEALALYQKALVIRLKVFGPDHADTAETYDTMAIVLREQGKLEEAMALYQKALEIRLKVQGSAAITSDEIIAILRRQRKENGGAPLARLATFSLTEQTRLHILGGSVVDYSRLVFQPYDTIDAKAVSGDSPTRTVAIVNSTNEGCLGGGPIDNAINEAGGESLIIDRWNIAFLPNSNIRCQTGKAVVTGPNSYGDLHVPYVIHAVGPNYSSWDSAIQTVDETGQTISSFHEPDRLLKSAFANSLEIAKEIGISELAFPLIGAGDNSGERSLRDILSISIDGISEWVENNTTLATDSHDVIVIEDISLVAYTFGEMQALLDVCRDRFLPDDTDYPKVLCRRSSIFETKNDYLHSPTFAMEQGSSERSVDDIFTEIGNIEISKLELHPGAIKYLETLQSYLLCFDQVEELYNIFDPSQKLANCNMPDTNHPIQQLSLRGEPVQNLMELYEVAEIILPVFVSKIEDLITVWKHLYRRGCDIRFQLPPGDSKLKRKHRASKKANYCYSKKEPGPSESWLCDIVRGSVVFGDAEQLLQFLELIHQDNSIEIIKSKNHFCNPTPSGYRDWNLQLRIATDDGGTKHICELQLHHRAIKEADVRLRLHMHYEFLREYCAGATESLKERLGNLGMISNGGSLNVEFLEKTLGTPLETDCIKRVASLFEHQGNDYQLAIVVTHAIRSFLEPIDLYLRLGNLFLKQAKLEKAMAMLQKGLEVSSISRGQDSIHEAEIYNSMANVLHSQGRFKEAFTRHQMSLDIRLEVFGSEHQLTASTYDNMACVLQNQGRLEDAMALFQKAVDIQLKTLGPGHQDSAQTYNNMAAVQRSLGNLEVALELYNKALEIQLNAFGPDHDATAQIYSNMAIVLGNQGKVEEAIQMYQNALDIRLNVMCKSYSNTTAISYEILGLLRRQRTMDVEIHVTRLITYDVSEKVRLHVLGGSILDYSPKAFRPLGKRGNGNVPKVSRTVRKTRGAVAIINATNKGCLGGNGLDDAINKAGGLSLVKDRYDLKVLPDGYTRCQTGNAVLTGPNNYGNLHVPYVIHTVGPIYWEWDTRVPNRVREERGGMNPFQAADHLLKSAYTNCLQLAKEHGISELAFPLVSAGINRGERSLEDVLSIAIVAICDWVQDNTAIATNSRNGVVVEDISLVAYTNEEMRALLDVCQSRFSADGELPKSILNTRLSFRS